MALLFVTVFFVAAGVKAPGGSLTPDQLREMTVHVLAFAGDKADGSGTGVVLRGSDGSNYVFTAAHVVPDSCDQRVIVEVHPRADELPLAQLDAEIVWVDRSRDFALLKVKAPYQFPRRAVVARRQPTTGQWVQHVGFFSAHMMPHGYSRAVVSAQDTKACPWIKIGCDAADLSAMPGCSGGPVFNDSGRLVGILIGVSSGGMSYYVPLFHVSESLAKSQLGLRF
jgi:S1-C subfamily serine protease